MPGAIAKAAFTSRDAEIVLHMSEFRSAGGLSEERFRVGVRDLKLFLRRADPIVRVGVAELHKAVEIHTRAGFDQGREAAGEKPAAPSRLRSRWGPIVGSVFAVSSAVLRSPGRSQ